MKPQNIFLEDDTYTKKEFSLDELKRLELEKDCRVISRFFTSKPMDLNLTKDVVAHQLQKVSEQIPVKHRLIFKSHVRKSPNQRLRKNGKIQQSVKDVSTAGSHTEAEHELLGYFHEGLRPGESVV